MNHKLKNLGNVPWILPVKRLVLSDQTGDWCRLQYYNHLKGCPKYNVDSNCPPQAKHISETMDLNKPLFIVHSEFDLQSHAILMKARHPSWTKYQARCVLYWQAKSRSILRDRVQYIQWITKEATRVSYCPEGQGVNVYATCFLAGLKLQKIRHLQICHHVAIIGEAKQ